MKLFASLFCCSAHSPRFLPYVGFLCLLAVCLDLPQHGHFFTATAKLSHSETELAPIKSQLEDFAQPFEAYLTPVCIHARTCVLTHI